MKLEEGNIVRFTNPHHSMNSDLKSHEGDKGIVRDTERGYKGDKVLIEFTEGSSKKVIDRWDILASRVTKIGEEGE